MSHLAREGLPKALRGKSGHMIKAERIVYTAPSPVI